MKKILFIASVLAFAIIGCSKKDDFSMKVSNLPEELNNKYAYILKNASEKVDSILIENGTIYYSSQSDVANLYLLVVGDHNMTFTKEKGNFEFELTYDDNQLVSFKNVKSPENSFYKEVEKMKQELENSTQEDIKSYQKLIAEIKADPKLEEEKLPELMKIRDIIINKSNEIANRYFNENKNNIVGLEAFREINFNSNAELIKAYEVAGDVVKNDKIIKERYEKAVAGEKTTVGNDFVDYEFLNENDENVKLSSFLENNKYLLIDFFASWCGPCKASMPVLNHIYDLYNNKGLNIVSIAIWDKASDYKKAVEDHKIVWNHAIDVESVGASVYGVAGVPTFILIGKDGKILVRTHNVNDIKTKLEEVSKL